ncbi:hypothetical protein MG290_10615 [Flavobacterium sp. CBA20B-1]|uniref:COG1470 family protein n=1 Tax=unclassified Flavobacterium TaxID=196869 RepID=UPI002224ABCA|nr:MULTISPECIES: hypothetical protein [unclassified Flavobacterium]WCM41409.1 hypothetical protein MG290_10615 [Flavobacterium sp. CBA20B-1]
MFHFFLKRLWLLLCMVAACCELQAQQIVEMHVETTAAKGRANIIDSTIALKNSSENPFSGFIQITTPQGFKSISGSEIAVQLQPNEQVYIPLKIIKGKAATAGTAEIVVTLLDNNNQLIATNSVEEHVEENNTMSLQAVSPTIFLTNANDSLSVKVQVSNLGNKPQQVFVVFSIPQLTSENNFFEQTAVIDVRKDSVFDFKFWVEKSLLEKSQFTVNVAAMRSSEKILFGNLAINVQNVSSVKRYEDTQSAAYSRYYQKNTLTTSYRTSGSNSNVYQLMGSGDVDLPAGYLSVNGNIYKTDSQNQPLISNTYLAYHLEQHQLKIGNLSQPIEMPLFGRGIQLETANKNLNNRFVAGFIDENFNLIEQDAFLKRGFGVFALGTFGANNPSNQKSFNYVFKEDKIEAATHQVFGVEKAQFINNNWSLRLKAHGGFSSYNRINKKQPSFAFETQYSGSINNIRLSGNYYVSSDYFPGNRRGVVQVQQNFMKNLKRERTVFANIFYANFAPESFTYQFNMQTTTFRLDTGLTLPRAKSIGKSFGFQYYKETSDAFAWLVPNGFLAMDAFRLTQHFNWLSPNQKHSIILGIEEGLLKMSEKAKMYPQFKLNSIYSFKGFNASATYQQGSFFLSEYTSLLALNKNQNDFKRLSIAVATDHKFFSNKLLLRSGMAYLNDFVSGETPSAFLNMNYAPTDLYRFFLNSSWFRYSKNTFFQTNTQFIVEAGFSMNLGGKAASAGRKGTLTAHVFYDKNSNNIFDEDDESAPDFLVTINKTTFKTNANGIIQYKSIPFGTYNLQAVFQNGWFAESTNCVINNYSNEVAIPLQQNGTLKGKIKYQYDEKLVKNFDLKNGGIICIITKNGQFIQRVVTNDEADFVAFLPTGNYEVTIDTHTLPEHTFCKEVTQSVQIQSGAITTIPDFVIQVQQKQVKVKKFGG